MFFIPAAVEPLESEVEKMKKLICFSLAMAVTSAVLLFKSNPPEPNRELIEKSKQAKTPLHIFKSPEKKIEVRAKKDKSKTTWVHRAPKSSTKRKVERDVDQVVTLKAPAKVTHEKTWQDSLSEKNKVEQEKAPLVRDNSPWLNELSGESANVNLAKKSKKKEECLSSQCGERSKTINLVGVVVETERFHKKAESLVAGDFHIGDAKQLPVVYVK